MCYKDMKLCFEIDKCISKNDCCINVEARTNRGNLYSKSPSSRLKNVIKNQSNFSLASITAIVAISFPTIIATCPIFTISIRINLDCTPRSVTGGANRGAFIIDLSLVYERKRA